MEVVIDSNVLFRTLISRGNILDLIYDNSLKILAPLKLKEEFINNKEEILSKSGLSDSDFNIISELLLSRITFISLEEYNPFLQKAKELLNKHEKDEDFIAICLMKNIKLWTYESLLISLGLGISTSQISKQLSEESKENELEDN